MPQNPRFIEYFEQTFFQNNPKELKEFLGSLEKSLPRTLRIKPNKIHEVQKRLESDGFILSATNIPNVFSLDRRADFNPLERRIGFTLDHLVGNFYIQELAAATSVHILTDGRVHDEGFIILDMASSPGGKTTQLSEHYPNAFIIANEPTRERIPQLLQNLDRMGSTNIGVTLYPGQHFRHSPEYFDRILLDAPCSGEGTLYKGTDATKHWHIKNIKKIASLQIKLLEAAIISLKVGGEMVYSTCSMNLIENEGVLEAIMEKFPNTFRITFQKRFWPHRDNTGGFYVAKIEKYASIPGQEDKRKDAPNEKILPCTRTNIDNRLKPNILLYEHEGKILALKKHQGLEAIKKRFFFMRFGERIGYKEEKGEIILSAFSHTLLNLDDIEKYTIPNEGVLDIYLRGGNIECGIHEGPILLSYNGIDFALEEVRNGICSNNFPRDWLRK